MCETAEFIRGLIIEETRVLGPGSDKKVILCGLSQGCAAGIFTLLGGWFDAREAKIVGAFVGMSRWLPFERQLHDILQCDDVAALDERSHQKNHSDNSNPEGVKVGEKYSSDEESDTDADAFSEPDLDDDPFKGSSSSHNDFNPFAGEEVEEPLLIQAINHIRDILDLPLISTDEQSPDIQPAPSFYPLQTPIFIGHGSEDLKVSNLAERCLIYCLRFGNGCHMECL